MLDLLHHVWIINLLIRLEHWYHSLIEGHQTRLKKKGKEKYLVYKLICGKLKTNVYCLVIHIFNKL